MVKKNQKTEIEKKNFQDQNDVNDNGNEYNE